MGYATLAVQLFAFSSPDQNRVTTPNKSARFGSDSADNNSKLFSSRRQFQNEFLFVPYGESAPTDQSAKMMISCDGKVPGTHLDLTHWTDNTTPDDLYADTSTEIALNFAASRLSPSSDGGGGGGCGGGGEYSEYDNALVCNNHYDTDGVLSIWSCLQPTLSLKYRDLLVSAAEAGDFGEWTSDEGVMLDCALESILYQSEDEALAYNRALEVLPSLLLDLGGRRNDDDADTEGDGGSTTSSSRHESLWREGFDEANNDLDAVQSGDVVVSKSKTGSVAFVMEEGGKRRIGSYALHRALHNLGLAGGQSKAVTRVLRATLEEKGEGSTKQWKYEYEMPGHGWVKRLVSREAIPHVDGDDLSLDLNNKFPGSMWVSGGSGGLVSICRTAEPTDIEPETLVDALLDLDTGAR